MPLALCRNEEEVEIVDILGGLGLRERLFEMGIYPGAKVFIVNNSYHGPIVIALNSARVALGRGIAEKIIVKPLN